MILLPKNVLVTEAALSVASLLLVLRHGVSQQVGLWCSVRTGLWLLINLHQNIFACPEAAAYIQKAPATYRRQTVF